MRQATNKKWVVLSKYASNLAVTEVSPESESQEDSPRIEEPSIEQEIGHENDGNDSYHAMDLLVHELSQEPGPTEDIHQGEEDPVEHEAALQEKEIGNPIYV